MKRMDPFLDGEGSWQGDSPGTIRKRFQCFGVGSSLDFCSNVTVFAPGEGSVLHNHPASEELCYVISGAGMVLDLEQTAEMPVRQGNLLLIERGEFHRIYNSGNLPLLLLMICISRTPMPEG